MDDDLRVRYWIQHADFTTEDHDLVDAAEGLRVFTEHDWAGEMSLCSALDTSGRQYCQPGIGLVNPNGAILHLCPGADGQTMVHYHLKTVRKFLGIPLARQTVLSKPNFQQRQAAELVRLFFSGDDHSLRAKLAVESA